jgi:hypothetical protein
MVGLIYEASLWSYGAARSNDCQAQSDWGVTNDIRADLRGFTGTYGLVVKDMVAYGSGTWVRMHDAWVLREGHNMVRMLLTGRTVRICQYWTYGRGQGGRSWLGVDRRGHRSSKWGGLWHPDSRLNRIDRILIPLRYTFFIGSLTEKNSEVKRAWPRAILGWVTGKSSRVCTSEDKSA